MGFKREDDMEYFAMVRGENVRMIESTKTEKKKPSTENKLPIRDAAELMGVSQQFIRVGLQRGAFPWGYAIQLSPKRYTYFISRQKFCEALGIEIGG